MEQMLEDDGFREGEEAKYACSGDGSRSLKKGSIDQRLNWIQFREESSSSGVFVTN